MLNSPYLRPPSHPLSIVQSQPRVPSVSIHGDGVPMPQSDGFRGSENPGAAAAVESNEKNMGIRVRLPVLIVTMKITLFCVQGINNSRIVGPRLGEYQILTETHSFFGK